MVSFYDARPEHAYGALVCQLGRRLQLFAPANGTERILLYDSHDEAHTLATTLTTLQTQCGWTRLHPVDPVPAPSCTKAAVYQKQQLKLRAWQLTGYDLVLYLDGDHWISGSLEPLIQDSWKELRRGGEEEEEEEEETPTIVGCRTMGSQLWHDRQKLKSNEFILNGSLLIFRPSQQEFDRIVSYHDKVPENLIGVSDLDCTEMGMLNAAYTNGAGGRLVTPNGMDKLVCTDLWKVNKDPSYLPDLIQQSKSALPESHAMHGYGPILVHSFKGYHSSRQVYTDRGILPNAWTEETVLNPAQAALDAICTEIPLCRPQTNKQQKQ
ncbi:hypothetical protein ACA910_018078 [Epithemia clementina (nom. ined.)]